MSAVNHHLTIVESGPEGQPPLAVAELVWPDEVATRNFAERLARLEQTRLACIELHGNLGAGKTTLVRYLLQALGVRGRIKSPTYAVVEPYELPGLNVWHFDFYRFSDPREWEDAGFRDIFASTGLKIAEWPQNAQGLLPAADLQIHLAADGETRRLVQLQAHTPAGVEMLRLLRDNG